MKNKTINPDNHQAMHFLEYNAQRTHLMIPEYGRHLQKLIDQTVAIADREERNKAAKYIIQVMGTLNPHLRDVPDFQHKLWDQIFIMSNFKLDVDSPYPIPTREMVYLKSSKLEYPQKNPKYRFYGNNIKTMIEVANSWEDGELKEALVRVIANHMKKSFLSWNKDSVEDKVIFDHLYELSEGKINLIQTSEELSTTNDLMRINKKISNKSNQASAKNTKGNFFRKNTNQNGKKNFQKNNNQNKSQI
ncbi:uncharacterized protein DUF4290 [Flavobacterium croceum DSM 17960]|jgi:hypothetical protein|uniref:Uncharacterized protein DUF4290 n=1 Tax=Flavobacterium croceum DSM 17960 TaxID=1121886 RepID=A0A2S4N8Z2_9FLAO|nr:DUF4290 domain-containing protein [Flavobacterium croceum]POS02140.1 uncharacterized protein DUF4290 [Flavobacterium croceum DSM 17960]